MQVMRSSMTVQSGLTLVTIVNILTWKVALTVASVLTWMLVVIDFVPGKLTIHFRLWKRNLRIQRCRTQTCR